MSLSVDTTPRSGVWFTADTHFGHRRIIELHRSQFATVEEMDTALIERWNSRVRRGDRVYHLGDFVLGRPERAAEILEQLHGQIFLIRGNHDRVADHKLCRDRFIWIKDYFGLTVGDQRIYLCHYAFLTWNRMHHGSWNLHGHSHGGLADRPTHRQLDVGVDCWGLSPISFEEVAVRMATKVVPSTDTDGGLDDDSDERDELGENRPSDGSGILGG